ncbi:UDP-N-acetylglucosamine 2-epimerase [Desulfitobacterium metallireducens]|uniref:UDP-N-acetylglucosamine 2-epimerase n=1 Tax=Desulfitobacterium metallireducens DSM 15288 TaxID=871968 RepID=W0EFG0_9FIRM|nr:UDP-N-acetylglucosamine 2-epimerase [Desulfitobacterium metallireducens]AHF07801.1 UDP-N-acetylglucosamine 2-epimerase [Desulfitobacterium metallireducens DSM 15288]
MKKTICIVTGTRAEYGLLRTIIKKIKANNEFNIRVVATGMHLSKDFGLTYKELEADDVLIDAKLNVLQNDDSQKAMSKAIGTGIIAFAEYFDKRRPDLVIVLGDRFEIFAAATAAAVACIPIAHLYGGETTEGAIDEFFRHSITKMSYLHFTSTEKYRQRVINMGESPDRVFNVGAMGVENILSMPLLPKIKLAQSINFDLEVPYALVTFHPVTLEMDAATKQLEELLAALDEINGLNFIFTKANADANGRAINKRIDEYCKDRENTTALTSLGVLRYLSAMKYCEMVIGNSSSGIMETPSFRKPTINIGDRQKGRICAKSVISCEPERQAILDTIKKARSQQFLLEIENQETPYGDGITSEKIIAVIKDFLGNDKINLKKRFYDVRG